MLKSDLAMALAVGVSTIGIALIAAGRVLGGRQGENDIGVARWKGGPMSLVLGLCAVCPILIWTGLLGCRLTLLLVGSSFCLYGAMIRIRKSRRRQLISRDFPLFMDFLVMQVEAGQTTLPSLVAGKRLFPDNHPIRGGLLRFQQSLEVGMNGEQALDDLLRYLDTAAARAPLMAISQSIRNGTPIGAILRDQSEQMRGNLILAGERFANTLSIKLLFPLIFFIFPASFLVILSPVIVSLMGSP